ncbi:hypothetical protein [Amycolatopsis pretoriensis]|uniref:hypothetical protein n=1 Tax=Amycolatopsis pretoriensis TaxID=218821 RepID=UPI00115FACF3|nr:hypothetical protein [Amycolatopsis pretoriensis]
MASSVRLLDDYTWIFGDARRSHDGADSIVIKRGDLAVAKATDLARELRKAREREVEPRGVLIDLAPGDQYSPKESVVDPISFVLTDDGRLAVEFDFTSEEYFDDDEQLQAVVRPLIDPLLQRQKAHVVALHVDGYRSSAPYFHTVVVCVPTRGKTLQEHYAVADDVMTLLQAAAAGQVTRDTVVDLLLGGRADLLIGLREGPWLDVKSEHYDLSEPAGQISLAQAISRFGNAEEGGVVVVGMGTKRVPGGEVIKSLKPVPIDGSVLRRYRQVLENRLFPFPDRLRIESIESGAGNGVVVVYIPPQEEELKPFLVHGAIVGDRVEGAFISIVRRSGEDSIPITAQQIHGTLAAGRALMRRGQLPDR